MSPLETLDELPGMTVCGSVVEESEAGFRVSVEGRLVEIPADSLLSVARAEEEVKLTLTRDARLLMHGSIPTQQALVESDVFDELQSAGREVDGGNCNCNCNGGNCNCNCDGGSIEMSINNGTTFRRVIS
jgi:hypothetical protein